MICPPTRASALAQLDEFIAVARLYARDRNHVKPAHPAVSKLAPAIRHRLISEEEVASIVLQAHSFGRVEKFIQEVYWRRYWKSWLALRPTVWSEYVSFLSDSSKDPAVETIANAESGNAVIDHFAHELVTTGYLHNHARMWFAAWWVHEARLPWQWGADFFFRHLLDGDPASNTLSWRWVAGLQTPGKTYLARRSNLEKYLAPELLDSLADGLTDFENPRALQPEAFSKPPITHRDEPAENFIPSAATGLWIHEEDLAVETTSLAPTAFSAITVTGDAESWERYQFPDSKRKWISAALQDAATRAEEHWKTPVSLETMQTNKESLVKWAKANSLDQVVAMRPEIGPLSDSLPGLLATFSEAGIRLVFIERAEDLSVRQFATGGFFQFWERIQKNRATTFSKNELPLDFSK